MTLNTIAQAKRNRQYNRLFYVGECDLCLKEETGKLLTPGSEIEYRKSLSGNMTHGISTGGMWWWRDRFKNGTSLRQIEWTQNSQVMCKPINDFVKDIDFTGMKVLDVLDNQLAEGSAIGNDKIIIGYLWNKRCAYRKEGVSWPTDITVSESISIRDFDAVFRGKKVTAAFYSAEELTPLGSTHVVFEKDRSKGFEVPPFNVDIAFKIEL